MEIVPWLGANLTALREVSEAADSIAQHAIPPCGTPPRRRTSPRSGSRTRASTSHRSPPRARPGVAAAAVLARAERSIPATSTSMASCPLRRRRDAAMVEQIRTISHATGQLAGTAQNPAAVPRRRRPAQRASSSSRTTPRTPLVGRHALSPTALLRVQSGTVGSRSSPATERSGRSPPRRRYLPRDGGAVRRRPRGPHAGHAERAGVLRGSGTARGPDVVGRQGRSRRCGGRDRRRRPRRAAVATGPQTVDGVEVTSENAAAFLLGGSAGSHDARRGGDRQPP